MFKLSALPPTLPQPARPYTPRVGNLWGAPGVNPRGYVMDSLTTEEAYRRGVEVMRFFRFI